MDDLKSIGVIHFYFQIQCRRILAVSATIPSLKNDLGLCREVVTNSYYS